MRQGRFLLPVAGAVSIAVCCRADDAGAYRMVSPGKASGSVHSGKVVIADFNAQRRALRHRADHVDRAMQRITTQHRTGGTPPNLDGLRLLKI